METFFENRYRMDRARWLALHGRPEIRLDAQSFGWLGLFLFGLACCVIAAIGPAPLYLVVFLPIAGFSAYRIFFQNRVLAARAFRERAAKQGAPSWDVVVRFEEVVLVADGNESEAQAWGRVRALESDRAGWRLRLADGDAIRLDPAGFAPGDARAFVDWLAERHPEVAVGRLRYAPPC